MIEIINFINSLARSEIQLRRFTFSRLPEELALSSRSGETPPPFLFFYINMYQYSAAVGSRYCREAGDISFAGTLNAQ